MINLMFNTLLLITFIGILLYTIFYNKKYIWKLTLLTALSFVLVNFLPWTFSAVSLVMIALPLIFYKKLTYSTLMTTSMLGSILCAFFLLNYYLNNDSSLIVLLGILSVVFICFLAIFGIMKDNIIKFLLISNLIQLTFVFLDLSVAKLTLKISTLGVIQIFNYTLAGMLLFVTLGSLIQENKHKYLSELQGYYYKDPHVSIFASIAAISLAGLPGLNIFVSEWLLFKTSFNVNPIITVWGIFAALLLFIMYFKIIYILLSGRKALKEKAHMSLQIYNWVIALACLVFGLLPFTQLYLLGLLFI
ncbi:MAG: hypothetical protein ISS23_00935 [Nanoarchaeota archaeon]|nr:hypothetical protein [Nanoarchaeota archaeon]